MNDTHEKLCIKTDVDWPQHQSKLKADHEEKSTNIATNVAFTIWIGLWFGI